MEVYNHARELLEGIADVPIGQMLISELLFLSRYCLFAPGKKPSITREFTEEHLVELIEVVRDILSRGNATIH